MNRRFAAGGRRVLARAGTLAARSGHRALDDVTLLLALAETPTVAALLGAGPAAALRAEAGRRGDRDVLATLGIDPDRVRGQAGRATGYRVDDPARWRLRRPPLLPLRLRLAGPTADLVLTEPARKAVEVAVHGRGGAGAGELDLLRGLLADARTPSVRAMTRAGADVRRVAACLLGQDR